VYHNIYHCDIQPRQITECNKAYCSIDPKGEVKFLPVVINNAEGILFHSVIYILYIGIFYV